MIALTGAGGFIGSVILGYLNKQGIKDIYLFDDLPTGNQYRNLVGKQHSGLYSAKDYVLNAKDFDAVIHFGANSSTLERNWASIYETNVASTRKWQMLCEEHGTKFIYASSAAIYGNGNGPLNHYAFSKLASEQEITSGVVLRLFNVYGPNEYHKGRMASTPFHWFNQLRETSTVTVFEHSDQYFRDFIYVEDVAKTVYHFLNNYQEGIYDLGTGKPVSFDHVADCCLEQISGTKVSIPMPDDLRAQYQESTCADTTYLKQAGVDVDSFLSIEQGIKQYYEYLSISQYY